jgi:hypothetical protein
VLLLVVVRGASRANSKTDSQTESTASIRVKPTACSACDTLDGAARFNLGVHHNLCGGCFTLLVQEQTAEQERVLAQASKKEAAEINAALPPKSRMVWTPKKQRAQLIEIEYSKKDASRIYWAEVAWWFDPAGMKHTRRWDGYVEGRLSATISYEHDPEQKGHYLQLPTLYGKQKDGPYAQMIDARELAERELSNAHVLWKDGLVDSGSVEQEKRNPA